MSRSRKPLGKVLIFLGVFVLVFLPTVEESIPGSVGPEDSSGEVSSVSRRGIQGIQATGKSTAGEADGAFLRQYGTGIWVAGVFLFFVAAILLWISLLRRRRRSKSRLILDVGKYSPTLVSARLKRRVLEKKSDDPPPAGA